MHFGAQSPWKYVVRRLRWENVGIWRLQTPRLLGFLEPKYGVCCWKVMDLNLFWKFGEVFFLEWSWSWMPPNFKTHLESTTDEFAQDWRHLHCWVASRYGNHSTAESCGRCALPSEGYVTSCSYGDHSESCPKVKFEVTVVTCLACLVWSAKSAGGFDWLINDQRAGEAGGIFTTSFPESRSKF